MTNPYYEHEGITIYHGYCREILPELEPVDLVLTDPPYGVSGIQNTRTAQNRCYKKNDYLGFVDCVEYVRDVVIPAINSAFIITKRMVITPGNKCLTLYPPPNSFGCLYQPASVGLQPWGRADSQPILYYGKSTRGGKLLLATPCSFVSTKPAENTGHPCTKPFSIWMQILSLCSNPKETVLDPFMGSGTTLVAAKQLGRKAIGIEIEEKYCEIAVKRLQQEVFNFGEIA